MSKIRVLASLSLMLTGFSLCANDANGIAGHSTGSQSANDPQKPLVFLFEAEPRASEEGPKAGNLMVIRGGDTNASLTVSYSVSGTALNEVDYQPLLGRVTIPAGAHLAPIIVTPIDDTIGEQRETVVVQLTYPTGNSNATGTTNDNNTAPPYRVGWPSRGVVTIQDNDGGVNHRPTVSMISPPHGAVFRGPLNLRLAAFADDRDGTVTTVEFFEGTNSLGVASNLFVAFDPATGVAEENNLVTGTAATFDPNQANTAGTSPILPPVRPFSVPWSNAPPGEYTLRAVATDNDGATRESAAVRIKIEQDTSLPKIEIFARDPMAAEGDTSAGEVDSATFVIHRHGNTTGELDVHLAVSGTATLGTDFNGVATSVKIPSGQRRTEITIIPIDDSEEEPLESVRLSLLPVGCIDIFPPPPGCFELGRQTNAVAWIRDNDRVVTNRPPQIHIMQPADNSVLVEPDQLLIVANARDNDGHVASVEFFDGQDSIGVVTNVPAALTDTTAGTSPLIFIPPWHLNWTNITPGIHVLRAQATDNDGAQSFSRPVEIRVVTSNSIPIVEIIAIDAVAAEPGSGNGINQPTGTGNNSGSAANDSNQVSSVADGSLIAGFGDVPTDSNAGAPLVLNTATFRVTRTGPTNDSLRVSYHIGGRARNGHDYQEIPRHITIPAGARSASFQIIPIDDSHAEGPENVLITLSTPSFPAIVDGLPVPPPPRVDVYIMGSRRSAEAIIHDNDGTLDNRAPRVDLLRPVNGSILHAGETVRIMAHAVDVDGYFTLIEAFANGTKVAEESFAFIQAPRPGVRGTFTLPWTNAQPGSYQIRVRVTDDDGARTMSTASAIQIVDLPRQAIVGVTSPDPHAREMPNMSNAADVDPGVFVFHRRDGDLANAMTVHYSVSGSARNGKDYHELSGEVRFAANETEKRVIVMPIDDDHVERTESVTVRVVPPVCPAIFPPPPNCYLVSENGRATVLIRDNDENLNQAPRVVVTSPRRNQKFTAPAGLKIEVHTRDRDGWVSQLEFYSGTNKLGDSVVHFIDPPEPGLRQRFSLNWTNVAPGEYAIRARATDNLGASAWSTSVPVLVRDTNAVPIVNIFAKDSRAREGASTNGDIDTASFIITRTGSTNQALNLFLEISGRATNGTDYIEVPTNLVLPAGQNSVSVTITPIDDAIAERPESVRFKLVIPANVQLANPYEFGLHRRAGAVILDNDHTITPPIPGTPRPAADALDDGVVHVVLTGQNDLNVIVETSDNLVDWFELTRGRLVNGQIDLVDIESLEKQLKYYRIIPVGAEAEPVAAQRVF